MWATIKIKWEWKFGASPGFHFQGCWPSCQARFMTLLEGNTTHQSVGDCPMARLTFPPKTVSQMFCKFCCHSLGNVKSIQILEKWILSVSFLLPLIIELVSISFSCISFMYSVFFYLCIRALLCPSSGISPVLSQVFSLWGCFYFLI